MKILLIVLLLFFVISVGLTIYNTIKSKKTGCETNSDCPQGQICVNGSCIKPQPPPQKLWRCDTSQGCIQDCTGSGCFATLQDCQNSCKGWECVNKTCTNTCLFGAPNCYNTESD